MEWNERITVVRKAAGLTRNSWGSGWALPGRL